MLELLSCTGRLSIRCAPFICNMLAATTTCNSKRLAANPQCCTLLSCYRHVYHRIPSPCPQSCNCENRQHPQAPCFVQRPSLTAPESHLAAQQNPYAPWRIAKPPCTNTTTTVRSRGGRFVFEMFCAKSFLSCAHVGGERLVPQYTERTASV